jgi:hypothetical protein
MRVTISVRFATFALLKQVETGQFVQSPGKISPPDQSVTFLIVQQNVLMFGYPVEDGVLASGRLAALLVFGGPLHYDQ